MRSRLTANPERPALEELADLLFVPSSILRLAHTAVLNGEFEVRDKYKDSRVVQKYSPILPYLSASLLEGARLYGYFTLGQSIVERMT